MIPFKTAFPFFLAGVSASLERPVIEKLYIHGQVPDPCAAIAGQKWVAPADVRECFRAHPLDPEIKANIIEVVNKTMAFHASTNYEILAPEPFASWVHVDIHAELARMESMQYDSEYDFHLDMWSTFTRVNDGHLRWHYWCYDNLYYNYLPTPLVLLTGDDGVQDASTAFEVASLEFPDQIEVWQDALPQRYKGRLEEFSGAKVIRINGKPPFVTVNASAQASGHYQPFGTRQNGFFSSYRQNSNGWTYLMGDFAQQILPFDDEVSLTVQLDQTSREVVTITLPYRSRFSAIEEKRFVNLTSFRSNNCNAKDKTNGRNYYAKTSPSHARRETEGRYLVNAMLDDGNPSEELRLPSRLQPPGNLTSGFETAQFFMLDDGITGILAIGGFKATGYDKIGNALLNGLIELKSKGATRLIVDVHNNGGGLACRAEALHRMIVGPKNTTVPQAGLNGRVRAAPLAQKIVQYISEHPYMDPHEHLLYTSIWASNPETHDFYNTTYNWMQPVTEVVINGNRDSFSPRLGRDCPEADFATLPDEALFQAKNVIIVGNGRCGSSCALFAATMAKEEGVRTYVIGGANYVDQKYCGMVGGQVSSFSAIDSDIKSTKLKEDSLAPPNLLVNAHHTIVWRLADGITDRDTPEEWQDHPATGAVGLTAETVHNPMAIWRQMARQFI